MSADEYGRNSNLNATAFNQDNCFHDCFLKKVLNSSGCIDRPRFQLLKLLPNNFARLFPKCAKSTKQILLQETDPTFMDAFHVNYNQKRMDTY